MHKGVYAGEIPPYDAPWFGGEARLWGVFAFFEGEGKRELFSGVDACMMERGGQTAAHIPHGWRFWTGEAECVLGLVGDEGRLWKWVVMFEKMYSVLPSLGL